MTYDMELGLLATQAMTELVHAEAHQDDNRYRAFLEKSAEFCKSIQEASASVDLSETTPTEIAALVSAVLKVSQERSSAYERDRLKQVEQIEPVIRRVLDEKRKPTPAEQLQIADVLYTASAADFE